MQLYVPDIEKIQFKYEYISVSTLGTLCETHESPTWATLWRSVCWKQAELCFHVALED